MHRAFLICSIALLGSCNAGRHDLFVDIKTDLRIPSDFVAVELTVTRPGTTEPLANEVVAAFELEGDLLSGVRIGELLALEPGDYVVQVELRDSIGGLVIARSVAVNLQNDLVLTVVITRDCLGVVCPGTDDDAEETECLAGRCVVPECDPELTPELCGDSICSATTPCPAHATACLIGACSDGVCLYAPQDSACGAGERCEVDFGCTSGCTLAMCDDGNPCTDDSCSGDACENAPNTAACDDGVFCNGSDTCAAGACTQHDGDPCGNRTKAMTWLTLDGQQLRSCTAHSQRHREGKTGGDFTRPIGAQNLIASDAVCELRHHGVACGIRSPQMSRATIDGTDVIVCNLHYGRHRTGKTGDDFTRPSTEHRIPADATCEIKHNGEACGIRSPRMRRASIDGTDLIVCNSHWDRYATRGITGDDLIKPIKRRR